LAKPREIYAFRSWQLGECHKAKGKRKRKRNRKDPGIEAGRRKWRRPALM